MKKFKWGIIATQSPRRQEVLEQFYRLYSPNQGFTLPIAVGIGLFIVLLGLTMLLRSQSDSTTANAQKSTNKGISGAEIAVARYQQLLAKYPVLAAFPYCSTGQGGACADTYNESAPISQASWRNTGPIIGLLQRSALADSCLTGPQIRTEIEAVANTNWQDISTDNPSAGQFRLVNYTFTPAAQISTPQTGAIRIGNGIMTVEGRVNLAAGNAIDAATGKTQVQVQIPVTPLRGPLPIYPGVWIKTGGVGNNEFQANVVVPCDQNLANISVSGTDPNTGEPYKAAYSNAEMPDVPPSCQSSSFNPATDSSVTCRPTSFASSNDLSNVSGNLTVPRTSDSFQTVNIPKLDANGQTIYNNGQPVYEPYRVYKYRVGNISLTGQEQMVVQTGSQNVANLPTAGNTAPAPDSSQVPIKVYLYVDGNISSGGNAAITHKCTDNSGNAIPNCGATDLHIYGYNGNGSANPEFCMNGNGIIEAFILAPTYRVGVAGSGGGTGGVKGAVWSNSWSNGGGCGSNTSNVVVDQRGNWVELARFININTARRPASIKPMGSWIRREFGT